MDNTTRTYAQVVGYLRAAAIPVRELHGLGHVAVTLAAGRVVALGFTEHDENLLWSPPELADTALLMRAPEALANGFGGDRLWFAPERRYHWLGKPDWASLSNYEVPIAADPASYRFVEASPEEVALESEVSIQSRDGGEVVHFSIERSIRLIEPSPVADQLLRGVDYVGIESSHRLSLHERTTQGAVDLWHLLQVPVGSTLIVPMRTDDAEEPLPYGLPGAWQKRADHLTWTFEGKANAKIGIGVAAVSGRAAVLRRLSAERWGLIVRQFPVDRSASYVDHPEGVIRNDQILQAWDGGGFGELEYHSPALYADRGPRQLYDRDQLWAFGGSGDAIAALASALIEIDIRDKIDPS